MEKTFLKSPDQKEDGTEDFGNTDRNRSPPNAHRRESEMTVDQRVSDAEMEKIHPDNGDHRSSRIPSSMHDR
ncbi:MAG: hypothetical protein MPW14_18300 [Candidatus Manganitrophus sp.]|nr:hypothetical protein [Candidatus Manganitrophus sp.]WDT79083.1 MAG: hypothetical protein MPW14_18300 [Candidatus Manganitrophus sp.]